MPTYPVRCCCQPTKVFGYLSIDLPHGKRRWLMRDADGAVHEIELREIWTVIIDAARQTTMRELAVYSDDRPIEFWRSVPGFREMQSDGERGAPFQHHGNLAAAAVDDR